MRFALTDAANENATAQLLGLALEVGMVLLRIQFMSSNRMRPVPFLVAGLLYVVFITVVIYHAVIMGVAAASH